MTVTMNAMLEKFKTLAAAPTNQTRLKMITIGVAEATILTGVETSPRNPAIKMSPNTRRHWAEARKGENDG